ncbi:MAG: hypothetical protein V4472_21830, partial [Pseudomonadota bacterium]
TTPPWYIDTVGGRPPHLLSFFWPGFSLLWWKSCSIILRNINILISNFPVIDGTGKILALTGKFRRRRRCERAAGGRAKADRRFAW